MAEVYGEATLSVQHLRDYESLLFSSIMNSETTLDLPTVIRDLWTGRLPIVHKLFISRFTVRFRGGV